MLFSTPIFVCAFLPVALAGTMLLCRWSGRRAGLCWLLACSLFFYGWWKPVFVLLLAVSILVNYGIASKIHASFTLFRHGGEGRHPRLTFGPYFSNHLPEFRKSSMAAFASWRALRDAAMTGHSNEPDREAIFPCLPAVAWTGLLFNIGLLAFFKYAAFLAGLLHAGNRFGGIFLPLGISFFTFQQIMFLVDTARGAIGVSPFLEYACFIAFFPHLIAGPIVRPGHIIPQFLAFAPAQFWRRNLPEGIEIFLAGLAKKLVLADGLSRFADPGFAAVAQGHALTLVEAWVALLAYALQIYFDFSGYSDMAIGLARMFGIAFPLNFNSPYKAANISDFWRRWNMTLSAFLRDYLYIPLGGSRHGEVLRIFALMATMLLGGLWHGAALRFMLWGGLHGAYLVIHGWFKRAGLRLPRRLAWFVTLLCVLLAWVPFRAPSFPAALMFYRGLFGLNGFALPEIVIRVAPALRHIAQSVPVLPYLGDARTLSLPLAILFLGFGWSLALGTPQLHEMTAKRRAIALTAGFAFTMQALFFAPAALPFLYFQF